MSQTTILVGDVRERLRDLADRSVQTCVTSPPYWGLRDYGQDGQLGLEPTPEQYVANMVEVFRQVRRVLRDDGTLWLNLGDSYASAPKGNPDALSPGLTNEGRNAQRTNAHRTRSTVVGDLKPKDLIGTPWMVAFALRADGWYLRSNIIWAKPNPMPESVTDRPTKAHEHFFLLTKSQRYFYDSEAVSETGDRSNGDVELGRNKPSVWTVAVQAFPGAHFATFPPKLIEPCILAGSAAGDTVLDPFSGAATTGLVAVQQGRDFVGIELNPEYARMGEERIARWQANPEGRLTGDPEPIVGQIGLEL